MGRCLQLIRQSGAERARGTAEIACKLSRSDERLQRTRRCVAALDLF
jgi:hypothetical protein